MIDNDIPHIYEVLEDMRRRLRDLEKEVFGEDPLDDRVLIVSDERELL